MHQRRGAGGEMRVEGSLYTTEHGAEIRGIEEAEGQIPNDQPITNKRIIDGRLYITSASTWPLPARSSPKL